MIHAKTIDRNIHKCRLVIIMTIDKNILFCRICYNIIIKMKKVGIKGKLSAENEPECS